MQLWQKLRGLLFIRPLWSIY